MREGGKERKRERERPTISNINDPSDLHNISHYIFLQTMYMDVIQLIVNDTYIVYVV